MKPYKSGPYLVGNRFLLDLRNRRVTFHCRSSMQLLAQQLPPDPAQATQDRQPQPLAGDLRPPELAPAAADPQPLTETQRLAVFAPAIAAALAQPTPPAGCARSLEDEFWGTSAARVGSTPAQDTERKPARPWTEADEARYQESVMWECAVCHWYEEG